MSDDKKPAPGFVFGLSNLKPVESSTMSGTAFGTVCNTLPAAQRV